jgi:hypothetical protein
VATPGLLDVQFRAGLVALAGTTVAISVVFEPIEVDAVAGREIPVTNLTKAYVAVVTALDLPLAVAKAFSVVGVVTVIRPFTTDEFVVGVDPSAV